MIRNILTTLLAAVAITGSVFAATPITSVVTIEEPANLTSETVPGADTTNFPPGTNYTINYGEDFDLRMTGFEAGKENFVINNTLQTDVFLRRNTNISGIPEEHQIAWYRTTAEGAEEGDTRNVEASFVPTMEELLTDNIINRGTDNIFQNVDNASGNINNVQRVDFIFKDNFFLSPQGEDQLNGVGFAVLERGGNDPIYVSAILGVGPGGSVTELGAPVRVENQNSGGWAGEGLWGGTRETLVVRDTAVDAEYRPSTTVTPQDLFGMLFTLDSLGVEENQSVFGYSIMPGDTNFDANDLEGLIDWLDEDVFQTDSNSSVGGLDLVSGGGAFIEDGLDITGLVVPEPTTTIPLMMLITLRVVFFRSRRLD